MLRSLAVISALFVLVSCSGQEAGPDVEQKINSVENNLIEFRSPAMMFQPDSSQLASPKTLPERMAHYKTPGVSIAVISDNQIEWIKTYGTMDVKTGVPVTEETIFEAASTSKFITAAIALHFVEKGMIDLDADVYSGPLKWDSMLRCKSTVSERGINGQAEIHERV